MIAFALASSRGNFGIEGFESLRGGETELLWPVGAGKGLLGASNLALLAARVWNRLKISSVSNGVADGRFSSNV